MFLKYKRAQSDLSPAPHGLVVLAVNLSLFTPNANYYLFVCHILENIGFSDEFEDVLRHTVLNNHIPFDFDSHFVRMHFGKDRQRSISYAEFTQLLHVCHT